MIEQYGPCGLQFVWVSFELTPDGYSAKDRERIEALQKQGWRSVDRLKLGYALHLLLSRPVPVPGRGLPDVPRYSPPPSLSERLQREEDALARREEERRRAQKRREGAGV